MTDANASARRDAVPVNAAPGASRRPRRTGATASEPHLAHTAVRLRGTPEHIAAVQAHLAARFTVVEASPDRERRNSDGGVFWDRYLVLGSERTDADESGT